MGFPNRELFLSISLFVPVLTAQVPMPGPGAHAVLAADVAQTSNQGMRTQVTQLFTLANQERVSRGLKPLIWDPALATAAANHCAMMALEGPIAHQYAGEADLGSRASQAGAHFTLLEENVAQGYQPAAIHQAWMNSEGHRENLLNPRVDHVGIAVAARGGALYAVADFSHAVPTLTQEQVEAAVSNLVQATGVEAHASSPGARTACAQDHGVPAALENKQRPEFIMRWEATTLDALPEQLLARIATGRYHEAAVGSCSSDQGSVYTVYRVAVLLLRPEARALRSYIASTK